MKPIVQTVNSLHREQLEVRLILWITPSIQDMKYCSHTFFLLLLQQPFHNGQKFLPSTEFSYYANPYILHVLTQIRKTNTEENAIAYKIKWREISKGNS